MQIKGVCHAIVQYDARQLGGEYFLSGLIKRKTCNRLGHHVQTKENARCGYSGRFDREQSCLGGAAIALN
ncbi:hypothetical protein CUJ84_Chr001738 [Rhizobium leguminosarum]|uniref:Uncharacterized protein n=1 Tax=Rhizobium leguminosarum TaxID=384 RepID=A0A2K9Z1J2_RHILE|nr:hypothetical protein CUJ84_Chr001738 [Rhizobium leguminosarum]